MPSEYEDLGLAEEVACQPAARVEGGSGSDRGGEGELFVSKDDPRVAEPSSCDMGKTSDMIFAEEVACQPAARIEGGSGSEKGGEDELNVGVRELRVARLSSADETSLSEENNVLPNMLGECVQIYKTNDENVKAMACTKAITPPPTLPPPNSNPNL